MKYKFLISILLLSLFKNSFADNISLKCERIYLEINTLNNVVSIITPDGTYNSKLNTGTHFYKFSTKDEYLEAEYTLDRRTLLLRTWSEFIIGNHIEYQCQLINDKTQI